MGGGKQAYVSPTAKARAQMVTSAQASTSGDKNEQKRARLAERIKNSNPQFGFPGTTHESRPFGGKEKDGGSVELPDGRQIRIEETAKGNNPYMKSNIYNVILVNKNGNTKSTSYKSEKEAVNAQKAIYEKEVNKIKKRYNL